MKRLLATLLAITLCATIGYGATQKTIPLNFDGAALDTTSVGMADSTGIIGTAQYARLYLWIKPDKPCKVAIQVRTHGITDFPTPSALPDTLQTAVWPWRFFSTSGVLDTLSLTQTAVFSAIQAGANELTVYFPANGTKWGGARALYIPLSSVYSDYYYGRNTSIRLRVLTAYGADPVVTWSASLLGVSF